MPNISLIIAVCVLALIVIAVLVYLFHPVSFDDDFIEQMIQETAEELVCDRMSEDELWTKDGQFRQKALVKIEECRKELRYFMCDPKARRGFSKRMQRLGLFSKKGKFAAHQRKRVIEEFAGYYEWFKARLQSNDLSFISIDNFLILKNNTAGDYVGVYVFWNRTKQKFYVGQAKRLFYRVVQHLSGHGNGDVYSDYRFGDEFLIRLIKLSDTKFESLDELEAYYIELYDAAVSGYNRNKGNQNTE